MAPSASFDVGVSHGTRVRYRCFWQKFVRKTFFSVFMEISQVRCRYFRKFVVAIFGRRSRFVDDYVHDFASSFVALLGRRLLGFFS